MPHSLFELLAQNGITLRHAEPSRTEQILCPKCTGGKTAEKSFTVSTDIDGRGFTALCHRGMCGYRIGARLQPGTAPPRDRKFQRPKDDPDKGNRPDWLYAFFAQRNIGARVVNALGVYGTTRRFAEGDKQTIVFPYFFNGELVNRKYRPYPEKGPQQQDKDALQTLYNIDAVGEYPNEIVFVEGEPDVLALTECGITPVVTLKDGAPAQLSASISESDRRFEALRTHAEVLSRVPRVILAGDNDGPGLILREELSRRLGRHRCHVVTWPEGTKDACDVLREHGPDVVLEALRSATPYPIEGLHRIQAGMLLELQRRPPPATMTTGTQATDNILHLPTEGRLIVVSGIPSHGKTSWTRFVMIHTARSHGRKWAVFSPEMQPWEDFVADCAMAWAGKMFYPTPNLPSMSREEIEEAERWFGERMTMLVCDAQDEAPTLDWILERATAAVLRDGCTDLLIDPWNEIEQDRGATTETEFIGRSLQRLKAFALRHGCNVWIIVHPAKPQGLKAGEKRGPPGPYDLASSAHWANKTDLGITIHSPNQGLTELHIWKTRFRRFGARGTVAVMEYDQLHGRYGTPVDMRHPSVQPTRSWHEGNDP